MAGYRMASSVALNYAAFDLKLYKNGIDVILPCDWLESDDVTSFCCCYIWLDPCSTAAEEFVFTSYCLPGNDI